MNSSLTSNIMSLLKAKFEITRTPWSEDVAELYDVALEYITDEAYPFLRKRIATTTRPIQSGDLLLWAAEAINPAPDADAAFVEVRYLIETQGLHGQPHPQNPNIRVPGDPKFSHPDIAGAVQDCGGWRAVCLEQRDMGVLKGQFAKAYQTRLTRRRETQIEYLGEIERRPDLFPRWSPPAIAQPQAARKAIAPPPQETLLDCTTGNPGRVIDITRTLRERAGRIGRALEEGHE